LANSRQWNPQRHLCPHDRELERAHARRVDRQAAAVVAWIAWIVIRTAALARISPLIRPRIAII
jgi:hypothetical protein